MQERGEREVGGRRKGKGKRRVHTQKTANFADSS